VLILQQLRDITEVPIMEKNSLIYVAGHRGMVGSSIVNQLKRKGYNNIVTATSSELDLKNQTAVNTFFRSNNFDYVFLAAAKVGGIKANIAHPAEFLYDNLMIQNNIFECCRKYKIKKLLFLGSSCIYPRDCPQPMKEEYLMTGPLEPTNEGYALAKIAGLKMALYFHQQYGLNTICPMPCNLYGANDHFDPENSHVLSALVKKFVDAVEEDSEKVVLWGTGIARREFLNVEDLSAALIFLMNKWDNPEIINVGSGDDISISDLATIVAKKTSYNGQIEWDTSMPDGMLRKCMDISKITTLGFKPKINLEDGILQMINDYKKIKNTLLTI
jgi:GDP-L-fucose synthase